MSYLDTGNRCKELVREFTFSDPNWADKLIGIKLGYKEIKEVKMSPGCVWFTPFSFGEEVNELPPEEWTLRGIPIFPVNQKSHMSLFIRGA